MDNNGKMRTSAEPNKICIVRKVLMGAFQKCNFLLNLSHCVKSYGHLCRIYHDHSSDMPSNSENFDFSPNSVLNFRKVIKSKENWLNNKTVTSKKTNWGWKTPPSPSPVLIGLMIFRIRIHYSGC